MKRGLIGLFFVLVLIGSIASISAADLTQPTYLTTPQIVYPRLNLIEENKAFLIQNEFQASQDEQNYIYRSQTCTDPLGGKNTKDPEVKAMAERYLFQCRAVLFCVKFSEYSEKQNLVNIVNQFNSVWTNKETEYHTLESSILDVMDRAMINYHKVVLAEIPRAINSEITRAKGGTAYIGLSDYLKRAKGGTAYIGLDDYLKRAKGGTAYTGLDDYLKRANGGTAYMGLSDYLKRAKGGTAYTGLDDYLKRANGGTAYNGMSNAKQYQSKNPAGWNKLVSYHSKFEQLMNLGYSGFENSMTSENNRFNQEIKSKHDSFARTITAAHSSFSEYANKEFLKFNSDVTAMNSPYAEKANSIKNTNYAVNDYYYELIKGNFKKLGAYDKLLSDLHSELNSKWEVYSNSLQSKYYSLAQLYTQQYSLLSSAYTKEYDLTSSRMGAFYESWQKNMADYYDAMSTIINEFISTSQSMKQSGLNIKNLGAQMALNYYGFTQSIGFA